MIDFSLIGRGGNYKKRENLQRKICNEPVSALQICLGTGILQRKLVLRCRLLQSATGNRFALQILFDYSYLLRTILSRCRLPEISATHDKDALQISKIFITCNATSGCVANISNTL